jgi:ATP-binding cassette subfamily F protein uup
LEAAYPKPLPEGKGLQCEKQEAKGTKTKTDQKRRLSFKEKRELEDLEKRLPELDAEKAQLEALLSGGATHADDIATASKRYQEVLDALDEAELRWLELSEVEG